MKRKVLIFPFPLLAHTLRCIVLADKEFSGDNVCFATTNKHEKLVIEKGYDFLHFKGIDPAEVVASAARFDFSWLSLPNLEEQLKEQLELIRQYKPDILVGDASATVRIAAEFSGVKFISLVNAYMTSYYFPQRTLSRRHPAYIYRMRFPALFALITPIAEKWNHRKVHEPFRILRRKYGLKPCRTFLDEWEGDETWICDDPELFPLVKLPISYRVLGPLYFDTIPGKVEERIIKALDRGRRTLLVTMGSTGSWASVQFLNEVRYAQWNIILLGDCGSGFEAPHFIKSAFADLDTLMKEASLVLCHAGNGTVYQALRRKKYLLLFTGNFEQEWNAERVEACGFGRIMDGISDPEEIFSEISARMNEV